MAQAPEHLDPREVIRDSPRRIPKLIIGLLLVTGMVLAGFFGLRSSYVDDGS